MDFKVDTWCCPNPNCKYTITDTEMQAFRFDFGCPKCKTPFKKFIFHEKKGQDND